MRTFSGKIEQDAETILLLLRIVIESQALEEEGQLLGLE
jgi:hypothetical protein